MPVDRCICRDVTFARLKEAAGDIRAEVGACDEEQMIEHLSDRIGCGDMCGLCRPYVKLMLRTGKTEFDVLTSEEWDELQNASRRTDSATGRS